MLSHAYNIIVGHVVGSPGHGKYVLDHLNATDKRIISMLMTTEQLPGEATSNSQGLVQPKMSYFSTRALI